MSEQARNKTLIEDHYAAFWSGDEDAMRMQLAADIVDHAGPPGAPQGTEAVIAYARGMRAAFPDTKVVLLSSVAEGDHVAVHARWHGTHKGPFLGIAATGKTVVFEGMVFWRIADGRIAERWAILDTAALMRQLQG
jgi:steroid delta-isomerase-like uncharacterized protein